MKDKVISIIAKVLEVPENEIELDMGIGDIPSWDSFHHLTIISEIQDEFDITFNVKDLMKIENVADLISLIEKQL